MLELAGEDESGIFYVLKDIRLFDNADHEAVTAFAAGFDTPAISLPITAGSA